MDGACSTRVEEENCIQGFGRKPKERDNFEDLCVDKTLSVFIYLQFI
jgi:hypothetical protein